MYLVCYTQYDMIMSGALVSTVMLVLALFLLVMCCRPCLVTDFTF